MNDGYKGGKGPGLAAGPSSGAVSLQKKNRSAAGVVAGTMEMKQDRLPGSPGTIPVGGRPWSIRGVRPWGSQGDVPG
jgi:hypothetical protein